MCFSRDVERYVGVRCVLFCHISSLFNYVGFVKPQFNADRYIV